MDFFTLQPLKSKTIKLAVLVAASKRKCKIKVRL